MESETHTSELPVSQFHLALSAQNEAHISCWRSQWSVSDLGEFLSGSRQYCEIREGLDDERISGKRRRCDCGLPGTETAET